MSGRSRELLGKCKAHRSKTSPLMSCKRARGCDWSHFNGSNVRPDADHRGDAGKEAGRQSIIDGRQGPQQHMHIHTSGLLRLLERLRLSRCVGERSMAGAVYQSLVPAWLEREIGSGLKREQKFKACPGKQMDESSRPSCAPCV